MATARPMPREPPVTSATLPPRSLRKRGVIAIWSLRATQPGLLGRLALLLDRQNLVAVVGAAGGADVMGHLAGPALRTVHELRQGQALVGTAVAATHAADLLLRECSHDALSLLWIGRAAVTRKGRRYYEPGGSCALSSSPSRLN